LKTRGDKMPTVKQRLKMRAWHARLNIPMRCARCGGRISCSFDIRNDKPVHFACAEAARVKGPERWERVRE